MKSTNEIEDEMNACITAFKVDFIEKFKVNVDIFVHPIREINNSLNINILYREICNIFITDDMVSSSIRKKGLSTTARNKDIVMYRQCAFMILYNEKYTLDRVGIQFNRDHSTVVYGINNIKNLLDVNDLLAHRIYKRLIHGLKDNIRNDGYVQPNKH